MCKLHMTSVKKLAVATVVAVVTSNPVCAATLTLIDQSVMLDQNEHAIRVETNGFFPDFVEFSSGRFDLGTSASAGRLGGSARNERRGKLLADFRYNGAPVILPRDAVNLSAEFYAGGFADSRASASGTFDVRLRIGGDVPEQLGVAYASGSDDPIFWGSSNIFRRGGCSNDDCWAIFGSDATLLSNGDLLRVAVEVMAIANAESRDFGIANGFATGGGAVTMDIPQDWQVDLGGAEADWITVVPLPAPVWMLLFALMSLAICRWRLCRERVGHGRAASSPGV
jgi:hypothetical protein